MNDQSAIAGIGPAACAGALAFVDDDTLADARDALAQTRLDGHRDKADLEDLVWIETADRHGDEDEALLAAILEHGPTIAILSGIPS